MKRDAKVDRLAALIGEPRPFLPGLSAGEADTVYRTCLAAAADHITRDERPAAELAVIALIQRGEAHVRVLDAEIARAQQQRARFAALLNT